MKRRLTITSFDEVEVPITAPVTKFGGQPAWVEEPAWPLSRSSGQPMRFIGQIALDPDLFGGDGERVAYLFMTDEPDNFGAATWAPDTGENAVAVQPGDPPPVETAALTHGPTLFGLDDFGDDHLEREYAVALEPSEDPDPVSPEEMRMWDGAQWEAHERALAGSKIGGEPFWVQDIEVPPGGPWRLLLQLDTNDLPFSVNFGDAGVGYAFLSEDGRRGAFLWQCG